MAQNNANPTHMKIIGYIFLGLTIGVLSTSIWLNHIEIQKHVEEAKVPEAVKK